MQLVEVDAIRLQPAQRLLAGAHDVQPRVAAIVGAGPGRIVHLGGDHHLVAPSTLGEHPTDHSLGLAGSVAVRRVDQVDATVEGADDHPAGLVLWRRVEDVVGAEREWRDKCARATEPAVLHVYLAPYPASTLTIAPVM